MKLIELIPNLRKIDKDSVVYIKKIREKYSFVSDIVVLKLREEELEWKTSKITEKKYPEYEYFLEVFLINEIVEYL